MLTTTDIGAVLDRKQALDAARADLDNRAETGLFTVADIQRKRETSAIDLSYRPSSPEEIREGISGVKRAKWQIDAKRLYIDCKRAVARYAPDAKNESAESLIVDAMHLILRWPSQGGGLDANDVPTEVIDLGGRVAMIVSNGDRALEKKLAEAGTLPRRADWILSEAEPRGISRLAWRALRMAVNQAKRAPEYRMTCAHPEEETESGDQFDLDAALNKQSVATATPGNWLPEGTDPTVLARLLDCPLDMARALIVRAYPGVPTADLNRDWGITRADKAIERGESMIMQRYPNTVAGAIALVDDMRHVARDYRAEIETDAIMALLDYRDSYGAEIANATARATDSVEAWRAVLGIMSDHNRALLAAARRAILRRGGEYGSARAETIATETASAVDGAKYGLTRRDFQTTADGRPRMARGIAGQQLPTSHLPARRDSAGCKPYPVARRYGCERLLDAMERAADPTDSRLRAESLERESALMARSTAYLADIRLIGPAGVERIGRLRARREITTDNRTPIIDGTTGADNPGTYAPPITDRQPRRVPTDRADARKVGLTLWLSTAE